MSVNQDSDIVAVFVTPTGRNIRIGPDDWPKEVHQAYEITESDMPDVVGMLHRMYGLKVTVYLKHQYSAGY